MEMAKNEQKMTLEKKGISINKFLSKAIIFILFADAVVGSVIGLVALIYGKQDLYNEHQVLIYYAIVADVVFLIYGIIKFLRRKAIKKQLAEQARREEEERLERERQERLEEERTIAAENARIAKVNKSINEIQDRYRLKGKLPATDSVSKGAGNITCSIPEVKQAVRKYRECSFADAVECRTVNNQINDILDAPMYPDNKLAYLNQNLSMLGELDKHRKSILRRIKKRKIEIINDTSATVDINSAFQLLQSSRICASRERLQQLISKDTPKELKIFSFPNAPIILRSNQKYYCIFSVFILVFNSTGVLTEVMHPGALNMEVRRNTEYVHYTDDREHNREYTSSDSKLIKRGQTRTQWLHSCKDGSPDLRYRDNYRYSTRTDQYEYGEISFLLNNALYKFSFSSLEAIRSFEKIASCFSGESNKKQDNTENLLSLIKTISTADESKEVDRMINRYAGTEKKALYCRLIEE